MDIPLKLENHPLYSAGKVEMIPTDWVWQYWGTDVSPMADLLDGSLVPMETLWENILEEGLQTPLIMRAGLRDKKMRLESGNHRIQLFKKYGVEMIPVVAQLREECGPHLPDVMTDATVVYDASDELLVTEIDEEYKRPSEVFKSLGGESD